MDASEEQAERETKKRCREKLYLEMKRELELNAAELKVTQQLLQRERQQRELLLDGEKRSVQLKYEELLQQHHELQDAYACLLRLRACDRGKVDKVVEEREKLRAENQALAVELNASELQVEELSSKLAAVMRSRAAHQRQNSKLNKELLGVRASLCETMARSTASHNRALALDARVVDATAQLEQAVSDAASQASLMREQEQQRKQLEEVIDDLTDAAAEAENARSEAEQKARLLNAEVDDLKEQLKLYPKVPASRSVEQWAQLNREARWKASQRERLAFARLLECHTWRPSDIAQVLSDKGLLREVMFETRHGFRIHFEAVRALMKQLETDEFGRDLGLFLHYEMHLTLDKILKLTQAACKFFDRGLSRYVSKTMLRDPWRKDLVVNVPRLAPPQHKLVESIRMIEAQLGVQASEEGRVAFTPFRDLLKQLGAQDAGTHGMPQLSEFQSSGAKVPIVVSFDATGFGSRTLNTIVIRNPYMSASNQQLRIFGLGSVSDDRDGTRKLLGSNLDIINATIRGQPDRACIPCDSGDAVDVKVYVVTDVAALRHVEHIAASGWCCCTRDFALRTTPKAKPTSVEELHALLKECHSPTMEERCVWSHNVVPGEEEPRACPFCDFAHDRATAKQQLEELLQEETRLMKDDTKAGKAAFCAWRMEHARLHHNIQPGAYGRPLFHHDIDDQILDPFHYAELN